VKPGAKIHPIDLGDEFAAGSAFLNRDGGWVYVVANGTDGTRSLDINNAGIGGGFEIYRYERGNLPADDNMIKPGETVEASEKGVLRVDVAANSVVLCRQK
jgi:alpha-galactosidase